MSDIEKSFYHYKTVDELTFTDDGMFQAVMRHPDLCAELIERLLHLRIEHVEYPELEKTIAPYFSTKGVRLDVYLRDSDKIIDVEMQSYPQEELGLRTRYYQSMIDTDSLMKGQDYSEMKSSYILFICKSDPFRDEGGNCFGLPRYTFGTECLEDKRVKIHDKIQKVIYNASGYEKESDVRVRDFLRFIRTNEPGEDDFANRLSAMVEKIRDDEKFRKEYAAMNLHDRDITRTVRRKALAEGLEKGIQKGIEKGIQEGLNRGMMEKAVEAAKVMLNDGMEITKVAKYVNLPVETINMEIMRQKQPL